MKCKSRGAFASMFYGLLHIVLRTYIFNLFDDDSEGLEGKEDQHNLIISIIWEYLEVLKCYHENFNEITFKEYPTSQHKLKMSLR